MATIIRISRTCCPICGCDCEKQNHEDPVGQSVDCPNCGRFFYGADVGPELLNCNELEKARLSHEIWKASSPNKRVNVTDDFFDVALGKSLPSPAQKLDLLLTYLCNEREEQPSRTYDQPTDNLKAKIGAERSDDVVYVGESANEIDWLEFSNKMVGDTQNCKIKVKFKGWQRYEEIKKGMTPSNRAFMAMKFEARNTSSEKFFREYLVPAMAKLGINLERVDTHHKAGMLDDKLRLDIRNSKFVLADLTHDNIGVTWEAGFAEGIGKRVYFLCNKRKKRAGKVHFDLNHQNIIFWTPGKEEEAVERLKNSIRYEFPDVRQRDPDPS